MTYSFDIYTEKDNFLTISGIKSEAYAKDIVVIMKDNKIYKVTEPAVVISNDNYKVVQIKKNLDEYLTPPKVVPAPVQPVVVPQPSDVGQPVPPTGIKKTMPPGVAPPAGKPKSPPKQ